MGADAWVKLLYTYGPFALLVFFFAVGETRARSAVKDPGVANKSVTIAIYVANWIAIFALLAIAISAWYRINFHSEFVIKGRLENLQASETLASDSSELYLRRVYGPGGHFDYQWRLITSALLAEGERVAFLLDVFTGDTERVRRYELLIHRNYYSKELSIRYDRGRDQLFLNDGSSIAELKPSAEMSVKPPAASHPLFVWKVEAQAKSEEVPIQQRLEASDPIIRQQARKDLGHDMSSQWSFIENSLEDPAASNRVKLGVIAALNVNKCADIDKLHPTALNTVVLASGSTDAALRNEARQCLVAQSSPMIDSAFDKAIHDTRLMSQQKQTIANVSLAELARTQLEVLYDLGIAAKDRYGSRQAQDAGELGRAVGYFKKAWNLNGMAGANERVLFAKALYGWGLALHDQSWIERDPGKQRKPHLILQAQNKFTEFLTAVQQSPNPGVYPYPEHLKRAEAYVKSPQPASLQL